MLRKNKKFEIYNNSAYAYLHKYCSKSGELPDYHDMVELRFYLGRKHGERERERECICPLLSTIRITLCGKLVI